MLPNAAKSSRALCQTENLRPESEEKHFRMTMLMKSIFPFPLTQNACNLSKGGGVSLSIYGLCIIIFLGFIL